MSTIAKSNIQSAPYPQPLAELVEQLAYKQGWRFSLEDRDRDEDADGNVVGRGLTLVVLIQCQNSYHPEEQTRVYHYFPVPPATYDMRSWRRWLFNQIVAIETHECMEFFVLDGQRPFAPSHGKGNDPYLVREIGTVEDQQRSFRD